MELPINTTHEAKTPIYTKDGHMDAKTNIIVLETTKHLKKKKKDFPCEYQKTPD